MMHKNEIATTVDISMLKVICKTSPIYMPKTKKIVNRKQVINLDDTIIPLKISV